MKNIEALLAEGLNVVVYGIACDPYLLRRALSTNISGIVPSRATAVELERVLLNAVSGAYSSDGDTTPRTGVVSLSPRQQQVLELYAVGEPAKRVATLTGLSPNTVHDYIERIRAKYALAGRPVHVRVDFYRRAVEDGILPGTSEHSCTPARGIRMR